MMVRTVVIGVGNPVLGDDAVGLHVARRVREAINAINNCHDVDVVELWAGGMRLAEAMVGFDRAILVDAMTTGNVPAGTVVRLAMADLGPCRALRCTHDTSLPAALEFWRAAGESLPAHIAVLGVEAQQMHELGEVLTPPVKAAVDVALAMVMQELGGAPHGLQEVRP